MAMGWCAGCHEIEIRIAIPMEAHYVNVCPKRWRSWGSDWQPALQQEAPQKSPRVLFLPLRDGMAPRRDPGTRVIARV